jgi:hypothetical protein
VSVSAHLSTRDVGRMIIVEGPDGAGKTTLVETLVERYDALKVGRRGTNDRTRLWEVTVSDTFNAINRAIRATYYEHNPLPRVNVWDRLFFSDMVYAPFVGRGQGEFSPGQQVFLTRILEAIGCPIILCMPPLEVVRENAQVHEQMKGVNENLDGIWHGYDKLYWRMPNQTVIYDYTQTSDLVGKVDLDQVFATIDEYLERRVKREWSQG